MENWYVKNIPSYNNNKKTKKTPTLFEFQIFGLVLMAVCAISDARIYVIDDDFDLEGKRTGSISS